jgi:hypothetical protein
MTPHNEENEIAEAMVGWACSLGRRRIQNFGGETSWKTKVEME